MKPDLIEREAAVRIVNIIPLSSCWADHSQILDRAIAKIEGLLPSTRYAELETSARSYLYGVDAYESMKHTGADPVELNECAYMLDRARDTLRAALGLDVPGEQA